MKKIIILVFVVFLSLAGTGLCLQDQFPNPNPTTQGKYPTESINNKSNDKKADPYKSLLSYDYIPTHKCDNKKAKSNANKQDDKATTDRGILWATIAIAFFALCQVVAMVFQYFAMSKQVKELRESAEITNRLLKNSFI
jgi:hypothetical protein